MEWGGGGGGGGILTTPPTPAIRGEIFLFHCRCSNQIDVSSRDDNKTHFIHIQFSHSSLIGFVRLTPTFFFKELKLSITTPTNRLRTKKEPRMINATK